jgi:hypothetical protein
MIQQIDAMLALNRVYGFDVSRRIAAHCHQLSYSSVFDFVCGLSVMPIRLPNIPKYVFPKWPVVLCGV